MYFRGAVRMFLLEFVWTMWVFLKIRDLGNHWVFSARALTVEACAVLPCDASGGDCLTYPTQVEILGGAPNSDMGLTYVSQNYWTPKVNPPILNMKKMWWSV